MYYSKIKNLDVANGLGLRVSLFVSGCPHHCLGCFNPETWSWSYGKEFTDETYKEIMTLLDNPHIKGLSVLGGEPLAQDMTLYYLIADVKNTYPNKDIWVYTGYTYEQVKDNLPMKYIDVLVDGQFMLDKKDIRLRFKGSSNQRIIDVQKTRTQGGEIVLYELD